MSTFTIKDCNWKWYAGRQIASVSNPGFPEPETRVFLSIFYYPKPGFFQPPNPGILKILELLLHSNISNSDNTEVADRRV